MLMLSAVFFQNLPGLLVGAGGSGGEHCSGARNPHSCLRKKLRSVSDLREVTYIDRAE